MSILASLLLLAAAPAASGNDSVVELGRNEEIQLALGAAPERLRSDAGVYYLGRAGYRLLRGSANGFNCLVSREPNSGLGPECFDKEGSETSLRAELMRGRLLRAGKSAREIDAMVDHAYKVGQLRAPRRAGVVYMLSSHFQHVSPVTGRVECIFPPHMMFYAPYVKNADIGAEHSFGSTQEPWVLNEGKPNAVILVVSRKANVDACK